jgi:D-alanyl-lipoteichoic acid acyltransferase DltB (MBOAT superfamily)
VISKIWQFFFPKLVELPLENTKKFSTQLKKIVEEKQLLSYAAWVIISTLLDLN